MFRTGAQLMFLTLIVGILLMRESGREPLDSANERFVDFLASYARRSEKPAPATLVAIDDVSLKEHPLPWTPGDYALFFNAAVALSPEVIATDEILDWKLESLSPETAQTFTQYAQILRDNVRKSPRTLLGAELSYPDDADRIPPLESIAGLRKVTGNVTSIPEYRVVEAQASEELRLATVQGFTTWPADAKSTRTAPLLLRYCGQIVPSFVLQAAMLWEKVTPEEVEVEVGRHIRLGNRVVIPIDAQGRMRINFALPIGRCGFEDLVVGAEQKDAKARAAAPSDLFTGRAILLSRTDVNNAKYPVALDTNRPRGELFALALGTIQNRAFVHSLPWWTEWAYIGFFTIAAGFVPYLRRSQVLILGVVAILACVVAALALIGAKLIALPVIVPVGLTLFLVIARFLTPNRPPVPLALSPAAAPATAPAPSTPSAEQSSSPAKTVTATAPAPLQDPVPSETVSSPKPPAN
jgi:hypothetical protein